MDKNELGIMDNVNVYVVDNYVNADEFDNTMTPYEALALIWEDGYVITAMENDMSIKYKFKRLNNEVVYTGNNLDEWWRELKVTTFLRDFHDFQVKVD